MSSYQPVPRDRRKDRKPLSEKMAVSLTRGDLSYRQIGKLFNLSRQRIQQIAAYHGLDKVYHTARGNYFLEERKKREESLYEQAFEKLVHQDFVNVLYTFLIQKAHRQGVDEIVTYHFSSHPTRYKTPLPELVTIVDGYLSGLRPSQIYRLPEVTISLLTVGRILERIGLRKRRSRMWWKKPEHLD